MFKGPDTKMEYRRLGNSGIKVSVICLGTMIFNSTGTGSMGMPGSTEKDSFDVLDTFVEAGGNFIDTANIYPGSEKLIGKWISSKPDPVAFRKKLVIATKFRFPVGEGVNDRGANRKHIFDCVENSLRDLQTTYIDLYQQHIFDNNTPLLETLQALDDLVSMGKVHYLGVSNFTGWQIQKAVDIASVHNLRSIVSLQPQYSLLCRHIEYDAAQVCVNENLAILPWSPLCGGLLSGKVRRGVPVSEGTRAAWSETIAWKETALSSKNEDSFYNLIDELERIGKEVNAPVAAVALRWVAQKKGVTSVIIGAKTVEQLKQNLLAGSIRLTDEHMESLDKATALNLPYPHSMLSLFADL